MVGQLTKKAIEELSKMLKHSDPRIRLRAVAIVLRHSDKIKAVQPADELSETINEVLESLKLGDCEHKQRRSPRG